MRQLTEERISDSRGGSVELWKDESIGGVPSRAYSIIVRDGLGEQKVHGLVPFQHGALDSVGVNGITDELLIAIAIDHLRDIQKNRQASRQVALALTKLEEAKMWLQDDTRERMVRSIKGDKGDKGEK